MTHATGWLKTVVNGNQTLSLIQKHRETNISQKMALGKDIENLGLSQTNSWLLQTSYEQFIDYL